MPFWKEHRVKVDVPGDKRLPARLRPHHIGVAQYDRVVIVGIGFVEERAASLEVE